MADARAATAVPTGAAAGVFDRYAVVAIAPVGIVEDLRKVRAGCPPSGRPTLECHVTVRRGFEPGAGRVAMLAAIRQAVEGFPAFSVRTAEVEVVSRATDADVILRLEESAPLMRLRDRLAAALDPLVGPSPAEYRPHVTIVERIAPDGVEQTLRAIAGWRVNYAWVVRDVELVGLEAGRIWRKLGQFGFGRP